MVSQRVQNAVLCGERWAENLLYRRYFGAALSFAQRFVERKEDAEEIANWAMYEAFRDVARYDGERGRFITWLYGIVKHTALDHKKSPRNGYGPPIETVSTAEVRKWEEDERAALVPTCEIDAIACPQELPGWDALTMLERACVEALDYGEPAKETAERLNINDQTVRDARRRARKKLQKAIKDGQGEAPGCK